MEKQVTPGERLEKAFRDSLGVEDKTPIAKIAETVAEILGFENKKSVYRVFKDKRELSFSALLKFREATKRTIDWLITGEGPERIQEAEETSLEELSSWLLAYLSDLPENERHLLSFKLINEITQLSLSEESSKQLGGSTGHPKAEIPGTKRRLARKYLGHKQD